MRFKTWLENDILDITKAQTQAPASAEVIKTGLQPQVDAKEIQTKQKGDHDKMMAIDGHVKRMASASDGLDQKKVKKFIKKVEDGWEKLMAGDEEQEDAGGLGGFNPSAKQVDYMKNNQPLPEDPKTFRSGMAFGNI